MKILIPILCALTLTSVTTNSQNPNATELITSGQKHDLKCKPCIELINKKPVEVKTGFHRHGDNLFFVVSNKEWFYKMFKYSDDGLAVEIVTKDQYGCNNDTQPTNRTGEIQKPIYSKQLKKQIVRQQTPEVVVDMGQIPQKFKNSDVEFNAVYIKSKFKCKTEVFYQIDTYRWDLLDMGFYFDSLSYPSRCDTIIATTQSFLTQIKTLQFEIPFEKNKWEYTANDIKPLYDSLRLTDFDIKKISIKAYSSIEGNPQRNQKLQQERAQSLAKALRSYQSPDIDTDITVAENWADFYADIASSTFEKMAQLDNEAIKETIRKQHLEDELEPFFKKHRKAVVVLELQKKNLFTSTSSQVLVDQFNISINNKNLKQASDIQNAIFERISNHEIPVDYIDKLTIPKQIEYSLLLNKNTMYKYLMRYDDTYNTLNELTELQELLPQDGHIKYNICALKFKLWLMGKIKLNTTAFRSEITDLLNYGIPESLERRMLTNFEIMMCEIYMKEGKFSKKDRSLKYIQANYKNVPMTDEDVLILAQYFASYSRYDWAIQLLEPKVKQESVDQNLLFYYLNLTLIDSQRIDNPEYRDIISRAVNQNAKRYCRFYNPSNHGGITFQMLANDYLRQIYCEKCH